MGAADDKLAHPCNPWQIDQLLAIDGTSDKRGQDVDCPLGVEGPAMRLQSESADSTVLVDASAGPSVILL